MSQPVVVFRWYGRLLRDGSSFVIHYWPHLSEQNKPRRAA
jgi:hypothetical protein